MHRQEACMPKPENDRRIDYIELPARDMAASKRFYASVFGWKYQDWGPDYADTSDGRLSSGLNASDQGRIAAPLVVVYASDLEAALERVRAAGGKIVREIFSFPGGRRFHFADPAGNELAIWSE
jgi:predicted enzyme related to lactoylglutathione lyase